MQKAENELRNGIDVNIRGDGNMTALHVAAEHGKLIRYNLSLFHFVSKKCSTTEYDNFLFHVMHVMAKIEHNVILFYSLKDSFVIHLDHDRVAKFLIQRGANIGASAGFAKRPPLFACGVYGAITLSFYIFQN